MGFELKAAVPILRSFDEPKAREFYVEFLGFEVLFEHRFAPEYPLYLGLRLDGCELHLSEHFGDGCPGTALRIEVRDLASYQQRLLCKAYRNARPADPQTTDWGTRELSLADPFGNRLTFFERLPGEPAADPDPRRSS